MTGTNLQIITFDKSQYGTSDYPMGGKLHSQWKTKIYKGWVPTKFDFQRATKR